MVVARNHDLLLDGDCDDSTPSQSTNGGGTVNERAQLDLGNGTYLQESSTSVSCANGRRLRIHSNPRSPGDGNWALQHPRSVDVWAQTVPGNTDVLVTHGPPRAHLDLLDIGCVYLLSELWRAHSPLMFFWAWS
ncbi:hypothetical protein DL765_002787 [Monosporascus sp. GIB2]|nr:hypothetical protein DL765_002787 [Monosporascus sp. GIB2]